jgi:MoaA/NifB/PqqE/SkfB family radical SAM enzyme
MWNERPMTLSKEDILFLLDEAKFDQILISGGEIFLEKAVLFDLLSELNNYDISRVILATTGIPLNKDIADKLANTKVTDIIVPFDGLRDYHDWNRGLKCFDTIMNNIKYVIQEYPDILVTANTVVSHSNIDQIPALAVYLKEEIDLPCLELHPAKIKVGLLNMDERFVNENYLKFYNYEKINNFMDKIEIAFNELMKLKEQYPNYIGNTKKGLQLIKEYLINPNMDGSWRGVCKVYNKVLSLNYNGSLSFCLETGDPSFSFAKIQDVKLQGLGTILESDIVQKLKEKIHSCSDPCLCIAYHEELEEPYLR